MGNIVDMLSYNSFTNLLVGGIWQFPSGQFKVFVQTSDTTNSGDFTDPTSGLPQLPTFFQSGGCIWLNSGGGGSGGIFGLMVSGECIFSGFLAAAGFQRPGRYARVVVFSGGGPGGGANDIGQFTGVTGFVAQDKTTGSGGGFSFSPGSGSINV